MTTSRPDGRPRAPSSSQTEEREQLLRRALDFIVQQGSHDLSLRALAQQIGTSHRMLIYHFGSATDFWHALFQRLRREQMRALAHRVEGPQRIGLMDIWAELSTPHHQSLFRLMFQVYGTALGHPDQHQDFLQEIVNLWIDKIAEGLVRDHQLPPAEARTWARLRLAVIRGLLLDLLTTGDLQGTTAAMALFAQHTEASPRH